jgi:anhydro-N-acetylmuramic acid kinase
VGSYTSIEEVMLVLGIMSGTSIDGVDYAVCEIDARRIVLRKHWQVTFPAGLRKRLQQAASNQSTTYELGQSHHDLGRFYAEHAAKPKVPKPQLVGLHGQTVFHDATHRATFQIGEPAWLAHKLRVPVVSNFRAGDLAAGGQGAPLATMFHARVFAERGKHICVNNLGGISNVTSLDWRKGPAPRILAFDTGPANMLIDLAVRHATKGRQRFDRNGALARRGTLDERLLMHLLKHKFFKQKPPKSTGRELFGETFLECLRKETRISDMDLVKTMTEFTARSIALNYLLHLPSMPDRVILCGGGAANPALVAAIRANLPTEVITCDESGWPAQAIEAAAFALLAWLRIEGKPGNLPQTTGASRAVLLGQITSP